MYSPSRRSDKRVVATDDGSQTLYSAEFDEYFHSTYDGALKESIQKHVKPAFVLQKGKEELVILDICFGLGYTTLATIYYVKRENITTKVHILAPEFDEALVRSLSDFDYPKEFDELRPMIESLSRHGYYSDEQFTIEILTGDARQTVPKIKQKIDIIYQDPFSPKQNPLLWTREYFADIRAISRDDAILTTYSTAIAVRMGLYENGFHLFLYHNEDARDSTVASPAMLALEYVDMELKKSRNLEAASLQDVDYMTI